MAGVLRSKNNPVVFFDISIGPNKIGRMKIELFADVVPKTAENFRQMCTGEFLYNGKPTGYKGAQFYRVAKEFRIEGGDIFNNDGTGNGISIYGQKFDDQNFELSHDQAGLLSMANTGKNKNGCQFFVTCGKCDFLDGKHVVFGKIIDEHGLQILKKIENTAVNSSSRPKVDITIDECGEM